MLRVVHRDRWWRVPSGLFPFSVRLWSPIREQHCPPHSGHRRWTTDGRGNRSANHFFSWSSRSRSGQRPDEKCHATQFYHWQQHQEGQGRYRFLRVFFVWSLSLFLGAPIPRWSSDNCPYKRRFGRRASGILSTSIVCYKSDITQNVLLFRRSFWKFSFLAITEEKYIWSYQFPKSAWRVVNFPLSTQ